MECKWTDATGCSNSLQREQCWQSCLEPIKYVQKQQFCLTLVGREQSKSRAIHEQSEVSLTNSWGIFLWFSPDAAFPRSTVWMSRSNAVGSTFHYVKMDTKHQNLIFAPSYLISSPLWSRENLLLSSVWFLLWNLRHQSFLDTFGFVSCKNLLKLPLPMFGLCLCRSSSRFILWIKSWPLWITEFSSRHTSLGTALTCRNAGECFIADIVQEAASPFLIL